MASIELPDPNDYIANSVLQILRTWKEEVGDDPLALTWENIDQLYEYADGLKDTILKAQDWLKQVGDAEKIPERVINED